MGGIGSGGWNAGTGRTRVESLRFISASEFSGDWPLVREASRSQVTEMSRRGGGDSIDFSLEWTPCNFGGMRPWLLCQECGRRSGKLYEIGRNLLACRICAGLTYGSQSERATDRLMRRIRKVRSRLGGSGSLFDPFPRKPPRMHWRTYSRLRQVDSSRMEIVQPAMMRQLVPARAIVDRLTSRAPKHA